MSSAIAELPGFAVALSSGTPRGRARAGVLGALLGDALGVPHEFKSAEIIPLPRDIQLVMPAGYNRSHAGVSYGTWSDDGSQLLCLLDSLNRSRGQFDPQDFGKQLLAWFNTSWHQAGGVVFDCGGQTRDALKRLADGVAPLDAGTEAPLAHLGLRGQRNGNGSLMRTLPAALAPALWGVTETDAITIAMLQSRLTHGHALSLATCGLYAQLALRVVEHGAPEDWRAAVDLAAARLANHPAMTAELRNGLDAVMAFGCKEMPTGSGYVANTFWSAILSLDTGKDYLSAVRNAIALGNDTDTTATVTGGLAGLAYGLASVPADWWPQLQAPEESLKLLAEL